MEARGARTARAVGESSLLPPCCLGAICGLSTVFISKLHETIPAARNRNAGACHSLPYKCLRASSLVNSSSSTMPGSRLW